MAQSNIDPSRATPSVYTKGLASTQNGKPSTGSSVPPPQILSTGLTDSPRPILNYKRSKIPDKQRENSQCPKLHFSPQIIPKKIV